MRILVFIALILSMAVSPAVALSSCATMGSDAKKMEMAGADKKMSMGVLGADDCDDMSNEMSQSHDAGCAAACALVCPGFYAGVEPSNTQEQAFAVVQYEMPTLDVGLATPSHLDPPPPRI